MAGNGLEIERKWLVVAAPSAAELQRLGARPIMIEQVYLRPLPAAPVRRVRRSEEAGQTHYAYTEKAALGGIVRSEREHAIDATDYSRLLSEADPALHPIRKTRHVFPYAGNTLELDVFDQPAGLVILEIEFDRADAPDPALPAELRIVREVSEDPAYLNVNLARG